MTAEVAQELGVHRQTINYWRRKGWLRVKRDYKGWPVLTEKDINKVADPIVDAVDYIIEIEPYTQQLELIVLQRLKYCGVEYEKEEVLSQIVRGGDGQLKNIIKFLKLCITVMKSDGRDDRLMLKDVEKAGRIG